jgi:coenzyme F420-reducing hydrogenase alpha subunit
MSQLTLNITDDKVLDKLLWMLERFKSDGVEIIKTTTKKLDESEFTEEFSKENWKEIISQAHVDDNYYKSEQYKIDRAQDWEDRGKI